jgi:hypothetical protein
MMPLILGFTDAAAVNAGTDPAAVNAGTDQTSANDATDSRLSLMQLL